MTAGNDNQHILSFNLDRIHRIYPHSLIILYDWGYSFSHLRKLTAINNNLRILKWSRVNRENFMHQKVICIKDCYFKNNEQPLLYFDTDVIINENIDEVFMDNNWDIAGTWRPESDNYTWLNSGVLFINNLQPKNSKIFLTEWERRCGQWIDQSGWLDQVELVRLFGEANIDLSKGPNRKGVVRINGTEVICKTLHHTIYNFLPEVYKDYPTYDPKQAKIFHLKSSWRKMKFRLLGHNRLRSSWLEWLQSDYFGNPILKKINLESNKVLRFLVAQFNN
jgi:hypothetical protein